MGVSNIRFATEEIMIGEYPPYKKFYKMAVSAKTYV